MGGQSDRTQGQEKWPCETHSVRYAPGLYTLSYLFCIVAQHLLSFLCCPRPSSHHPSSLTLVYLIPALHLLLPSTPFWPYGTHPLFPHAQIISILHDPLYSLTLFLFQLSYAPLHSWLNPFVILQPNFSNTSSQEHSIFFSQHFSYSMPLLHTFHFVQLLLHIDTSWLYPQCSIAEHAFQHSHTLYPSFILCTTSLSFSSSAATSNLRYLKQSTFSDGSPFSITCNWPHNYTLTYIHSQLSSFAYSTKLTHQSTQLLWVSH